MSRKSDYNLEREVALAKEYLKAGRPIIVFDVESTGLSTIKDRIISFSAIKVVFRDGYWQTIDSKDIFINPGFHIPDDASAVNGITDDMVKDCPSEEDVVGEIYNFFGDEPFISGYNSVRFDAKMVNQLFLRHLGKELKPILHIDVLSMAREKLDIESHSLENVADYMGCSGGIEFHRSIEDVKVTFRVFCLLMGTYCEEEEKPLYKVTPTKAVYWSKGHRLQRIYIQTVPYTKTYYDLYKKQWKSDSEIDLDDLQSKVFSMYSVTSAGDLYKVISVATA